MSFLDSLLSKSQSSPAQTALVAAAVVAAGYGAYSWLFSGAASSDLAPAVTEEEARKIMGKIVEAVKLNVPRFVRAADSIKQQIAAQGQEIEDAQIFKSFILPHLENSIREITQATLDEFDIDEDELEEAVDTYIEQGDDALKHFSEQLKMIYKQFGGEVASEQAEAVAKRGESFDMSLEDVVTLLEEMVEMMVSHIDQYCEQFVAAYGVPKEQAAVNKFQMGLMQVTEEVEKELLSSRGMISTDFQNILMKYQTEPKIGELFMMMQMQNKHVLMEHGIPLSM